MQRVVSVQTVLLTMKGVWMSDRHPFVVPSINDEDIDWACRILALPGFDEPRKNVLRSMETLDVEACPGSGKTTLLVAKLAILAFKWTDRRRGVCVLSHTNVARREIQNRLGNTAAGQRLLSYPHFVGTIHGFINECLALPWLRSKGFLVKMIDNEVCEGKRWRKIDYRTKLYLKKNWIDYDGYRVINTQYDVQRKNGSAFSFGTGTTTYNALRNACSMVAKDGYFCHDDMFVWARDLIDSAPHMLEYIRERFPLLFIDEVQDNGEDQSSLLYSIFCEGDSSVIRQRFGDSNQAIYDYAGQQGATTDLFPDLSTRRDLPNSYRFGQQIADFADPLGLNPHGLQGQGPCSDKIKSDTTGKHAIFLFAEQMCQQVIPAYAGYLLDVFPADEVKQGEFTAVGSVHRPPSDDKHHPRTVCHYWTDYDHEFSRFDPRPKSFVQYVQAGQAKSLSTGESQHAVEKIAEAFLHVAGLVGSEFKAGKRRYRHRQIVELLRDNESSLEQYLELVHLWVVIREKTSKTNWNNNFRNQTEGIVCALCGEECNFDVVGNFLVWPDSGSGEPSEIYDKPSDNIYRHKRGDSEVCIRLGSIHSVKGETHTATLVLETFYKAHHLVKLKGWILGLKSGRDGTNDTRLKQHYVAMTRPTHLLCMAMKENSLRDGDIQTLQQGGFRVGHVQDGGTVRWCPTSSE